MMQWRQILIALNTRLDLSRDAICRMGQDPGAWMEARGRTALAVVGESIGVSRRHLLEARRMRRHAPSITRSEVERAKALDATIVTLGEPDYPSDLLDLELPPPVLFVRGRLPDCPALAIVGSRRADPYALEAARLFARELARCGLAIVSGLARGVDAAAHRGALEAEAGSTVAVQACGIDRTYPAAHARLASDISSHGVVLTEFPIGAAPMPRNFPIRNRLIAALSLGTLVVQAARRSGTLITARLALELGREVYALPGPIFLDRAKGANELLRDGAIVTLEPRDILESLPLAIRDRLQTSPGGITTGPPVEGFPAKVLGRLSGRAAMAPDELSRELCAPVDTVLAALLELELAGHIRRYPGPLFHLSSS